MKVSESMKNRRNERRQDAVPFGLYRLVLIAILLLLPISSPFLNRSDAGASPDAELPVPWLREPAESILRRDDADVERILALCENLGWCEKEYRIREARLFTKVLTFEEREREKQRLAHLAVLTRRDREAIDLLDPWRRGGAEVFVAAGLAALRAGEYREAAKLLRAGQAAGPPAGDLVRFRLAEALRPLAEEDHGLPLLLEIASDKTSRYRRTALHQAALLLFDAGETSRARELLQGEYGADYDDLVYRELIFLAAREEARLGESVRAARLYKRLLERWPEHRRALESYRALRTMETEGRISVDERLSLLGARAARLGGRSVEAVQLLQPFLDRSENDRLRLEAHLEIGKIHYGAERYRSALRTFEELADREGEHGRIALLYIARSWRKMSEWSRSIDAYEAYVRRYPNSTLSPEVQWEISWRLKMLGEHRRAAESFATLVRRFPGSDFAGRAPYQEALCLDAAGEPTAARTVLEKFVRSGGGGNDRDDALFWIGDLGERLDDPARSKEAYRELVDEFPETYYGLRAAGRLGEASIQALSILGDGGETDDPALRWIRGWSGGGAAEEPPRLDSLELYVAFGEWGEARRHARDLRRRHSDDPEALLGLARLCRRLALFESTIRCGRRLQTLAERADADPVHPHLLVLIYPLAYLDRVVIEAAAYEGMDPLFILALMRQESWFQTDATSPAGARGLMQIMPSTGRHIARSLGEASDFNVSNLYDPNTNIRYGVWYIHTLAGRYQGDRIVVASAYNAGEARADLWLGGGGPLPRGDYVERINLSETRTYVQRILSGYWICRSLYSGLGTLG